MANDDGDVYVESAGQDAEIVLKTQKVRVDGDVYTQGSPEGLSSQVGSLRSLLQVQTSTTRTQYKVVSYNPTHYEKFKEGLSSLSGFNGEPPTFYNSSFIDAVKREGVDNATIFETCLYPTQKMSYTVYSGSFLSSFYSGPFTTYYLYVGKRYYADAQPDQIACVKELLFNKLAESNWTFASFVPSLSGIYSGGYSGEIHTLTFSRSTTGQ